MPPTPSRRAPYLLAVLTIVWFLAYLDRKIIALLVSDLKRDLLLTDVQARLLQGVAFAVLFDVAGLPIGQLVDRYNRRNIVIVGVLLWSAATILCGFATSYESLFVTRMFVGLGEACLAPAAASMVADAFSAERRGRAMGTMLTGGAVGTGASAFLAGAVMARFAAGGTGIFSGFAAWQLTFIAAGLGGIVVVPLLLTIGEPPRQQAAGPSERPAAQTTILAVLREHWRLLVPLYIGFVANMVAAFGTSAWIPTMLMRDYHMTAARVGVILGTLLLGMGIVSPILGGWASDLAARRNAATGRLRLAGAMFVVQAGLGAAILLLRDLEPTLATLAVNSLASSCLAASAMVVLQESGPPQVRGQSIAVYLVATNVIGMGLGPLFVALLTDHVFGSEAMVRQSVAATLAFTGALGVAMMLVALGSAGRRRPAAGQPEAA
jgi:MFS family permease